MRPERVTKRQAQTCYDAIREHITLAPLHGEAVTLPTIDMDTIFGKQKSMTWYAVCDAVNAILQKL